MKSLPQLYRLHTNSRSLHVPGVQFVPPRWYSLGLLIRKAVKKQGLKNPFELPPFDQSPATC